MTITGQELGNQLAYPTDISFNGQVVRTLGLTKREYFAAIALQGILSGEGASHPGNPDAFQNDISRAVSYADALLKALAGESGQPEANPA